MTAKASNKPRLSTSAVGRDNHFNLIRFLAARGGAGLSCVPLALGAGYVEPLKNAAWVSLGGSRFCILWPFRFFRGSYVRQASAFLSFWPRVPLWRVACIDPVVALITAARPARLTSQAIFPPETGRFLSKYPDFQASITTFCQACSR